MNKMKRVFSFMLVLSMVLGTLTAFAPQNAFAAEEAKVEETAVVETKVEETKATEVKKDETKVLKEVPKDVIGTPHEKSIRRLIAFGIVGGYPDGTYKPEEEVTRAQFSKIIVEALGLGDAVPAAQNNKTGFPDVDAYVHWASGYINVASGQGLILGYEDGTFKPEQPVSYAEALTMLVRSLGYEDKFLKGEWPGNYVAKAADVGITKGVQIPANTQTGATRGYVADLVNNTLDAKIVRAKTYTGGNTIVEYETTDITLLKDKLDISKHEDTRIFADKIVNDGLNKDEVSVRFLADTKNKYEVRKEYKENDKADFRAEAGLNLRPFVGEEVTTYLTKNDRIIYIEKENDDKAKFDAITEIDGDKIELYDFDKKYAFDKDADVYIFDTKNDRYEEYRGDELDKKEIEGLKLDDKLGKFVVKNNKIVFAEIMDSSEAAPWFLTLKNDKGQLEGINKDTEDFKLDLRKDGSYDYVLAFDIAGNEVKVEDIEKGNLLYVQAQSYDGDDIAVVTVVADNKLEGKMGKFREDRVEIDGKFVKAIGTTTKGKYNTYYTVNTVDDIEEWNVGNWENDFDDAYNKEVTVYKDAVGRIAFLTTDVETKSGYKFGVVTRTYADGDRVRIFTTIDGKEGKDIVFKAEKERDIANAKVLKADGTVNKDGKVENILGQAVKFRLNKDNEIVDGEFFVMEKEAVYTMRSDFGKDTLRLTKLTNLGNDIDSKGRNNGDASFSVRDNISIVDAEGLNTLIKVPSDKAGDIETYFSPVDVDDFGIAEWKDMKSTKKDENLRFYVFPNKTKGEEAEAIVFVGKLGANTASDKEAVYVRDRWRKGDDIIVEYMAYGENQTKEAIVDGAKNISEVERRMPFVLEARSNGKVKVYEYKGTNHQVVKDNDVSFEYVEGKVESITGSNIKLDGKTYTISNSTVTYDAGDKKSISNIKKGDYILAIIEDEIRVRVVKLDYKSSGSNGGNTAEELKGIVTYVNKYDKNIEIDNKEIFKINDRTKFVDNNGRTLAIGSEIVEGGSGATVVAVNDQVETNAKDNVIKRLNTAGEVEKEKELRKEKALLQDQIDESKVVLAKAKKVENLNATEKEAVEKLETEIKNAEAIVKNEKDVTVVKAETVTLKDQTKKVNDDIVSKEDAKQKDQEITEKAVANVERAYSFDSAKTEQDLVDAIKADAIKNLTVAEAEDVNVDLEPASTTNDLKEKKYEVVITKNNAESKTSVEVKFVFKSTEEKQNLVTITKEATVKSAGSEVKAKIADNKLVVNSVKAGTAIVVVEGKDATDQVITESFKVVVDAFGAMVVTAN